jgi:hypothetical protein
MGVLVVRDAHAVLNETQQIGHEVSSFGIPGSEKPALIDA